jgi:hypothetical protein
MTDMRGRPNHINDALAQMHPNYWYVYTSKEQVYANLRLRDKIGVGGELVDNPVTELPTEEVVNAKLKEMQDKYDDANKPYKLDRIHTYPYMGEQFDLLYHDMIAGKLDTTGEWHKAIKKIKDDNPKV